jgi:hypothetical protein
MTLRRIGDLPKTQECRSREHDPPTNIVLKPGVYEHTCPACGWIVTFRVEHKGA